MSENSDMVICKYANVCEHYSCGARTAHIPTTSCAYEACMESDKRYEDAVCVPVGTQQEVAK